MKTIKIVYNCFFARENKGQTLMELLVVTAVSIIIIGALVFATITSLRNAQFSKNQTQATKLAQEGIEQIRSQRDRNQCITDLDASVKSWNGNSDNASCPGSGALWDYQISGTTSGSCENTNLKSKCYFKIAGGSLENIDSPLFPTDAAEGIPPPPSSAVFRRVVTLSDDASFGTQKTVTVIVQWKDFSGDHESKLTTILRRR